MKRSRLIVWGTLLALAAWGFAIEPGWLKAQDLELASDRWQAPPITIAMAADFHTGAPHAGLPMLQRVVAGINAAHPDMVLLPGDFVIQEVLGGQAVAPETIASELGKLHAPLGVFATLGNHDVWWGAATIRKALAAAGIEVLENEAKMLSTANGPLWLAGLGDDMTGQADPAKAFAQVPPKAKLIVMMHDPANAPDLPAQTVVAFAGHTHGGQVRLPLLGALITPGRSPLSHAYGWLSDVPAPTYVTSGIGTSILPVRFNCRPEYVVLHLRSQEKS